MTFPPFNLTETQISVINQPLQSMIFLSGFAGTGKTTTGVGRVLKLLENGIPGNEILLLFPQRTLAAPFIDAVNGPNSPSGGVINLLTIGGLARRMVDLFWPLVADETGFARPDDPPVFLTLETAQYFMAHLVRPLIDEGYFESVTLDRNRLYSQILDNLSKSAVHGFPHTEIGDRLKSAWVGERTQEHIYDDVQYFATKFRQYCLENNLLDFSLQLEIFKHQIWPYPLCRETIIGMFRHLVFDNIEEGTPFSYDLLDEWLPSFESAMLIFDEDAGYRRFLGAEPEITRSLKNRCTIQVELKDGFVTSEALDQFSTALTKVFDSPPTHSLSLAETKMPYLESPPPPVNFPNPGIRFFPVMLDWVADRIDELIKDGIPPGEIVVLAPYLSDVLRYSLDQRLDSRGIPSHSHRPSRSLREEPATLCMLTLAKLAFPSWGIKPTKTDFTYMLMGAISGMDLVRAQLLTEIVYRKDMISPFDQIEPQIQERITYVYGELYENLRKWLIRESEDESKEMDHFLRKLFGEVLSQPGYGFHDDFEAGTIAAKLIESVEKFRQVVGGPLADEEISYGKEYLQMVQEGVIAAQYLKPWQRSENSVFITPAYTFLMSNQPVDYQFWLDVGSRGWYERLNQPLTHPYVLSRGWPHGNPWTDVDEAETSRDSLFRLSSGLIRRCRRGIYLGLSNLGEGGYEHKGELLRVIDRALLSYDQILSS